jgi:hypothetical protein
LLRSTLPALGESAVGKSKSYHVLLRFVLAAESWQPQAAKLFDN